MPSSFLSCLYFRYTRVKSIVSIVKMIIQLNGAIGYELKVHEKDWRSVILLKTLPICRKIEFSVGLIFTLSILMYEIKNRTGDGTELTCDSQH